MENKEGQIETVLEPVKKSRWWVWLIAVLVLIVVSVGAWFLFGGDGGTVGGIGSSIPSPPALPA